MPSVARNSSEYSDISSAMGDSPDALSDVSSDVQVAQKSSSSGQASQSAAADENAEFTRHHDSTSALEHASGETESAQDNPERE